MYAAGNRSKIVSRGSPGNAPEFAAFLATVAVVEVVGLPEVQPVSTTAPRTETTTVGRKRRQHVIRTTLTAKGLRQLCRVYL